MTRLIAGGYAEAGARGLYMLDAEAARLTARGVLAPVVNVSAGLCLPGTDRWFLVDERANRIVLLDAGAGWRELASVDSGGEGPCHLAYDVCADVLACANYDSGTIAVFRLDCGFPTEPPAFYQNTGCGPNADRQEGPHVHWVGFGAGRRLYATDLGVDRVLCFSVTREGPGAAQIAYVAPPGSGPRQIAFHPTQPVAFLVSELASTLSVLDIAADGALTARAILSTLPAGAEGDNLAGAIALSADAMRIYVSNRGHDSIATFAIAPEGDASPIGHTATGGSSPRFVLLDDDRLFVGHERTGGVTVLPLAEDGCPLAPIARGDVPGAAFLGVLPT